MTPLLSSTLLRAQTDARLLELVAAGHDRAFEAIVERYRRPLQRYLRRLLSDSLAEDVLQATFLSAWSSLRAGTQVRDLKPWLYRIAHNGAINVLKRAGEALEEIPESVGDFTGPETELERRDEMRRTLWGVASLPSRQRAALLAVAVDGRAHSDIAAELGLTDGAVRQLVHRARTTLRSAATAITPTPLLNLMLAGHDATVARVAEVAAGAGGAGAASLSLKAGAAAVLATGALVTGGPKVVDVVTPHHGGKPAARAKVAAAPHRSRAGREDGSALAAPILVDHHRRRHHRGDDAKGSEGHRHRHEGSGGGADDHGGTSSNSGPSAGSGPSLRSGPPVVDDHGGESGSGERHHTRRHSGSTPGSDSRSGSGEDGGRHRHRHRGGSGTSGGDDGPDLAGDDKSGTGTRSGHGGADDGAEPSTADDHVQTTPVPTASSSGSSGHGGGGDDAVTEPAPAPTVAAPDAAPTAPPADDGGGSGKLRAGDASASGSGGSGSGNGDGAALAAP
jgi:RNA polymerase sigma factor (sigma-70 family)